MEELIREKYLGGRVRKNAHLEATLDVLSKGDTDCYPIQQDIKNSKLSPIKMPYYLLPQSMIIVDQFINEGL